jgi:DNA modification methylase
MSQKYKAVYFADSSTDSASKSLTIAFGKRASQLYGKIKNFSSAEIRQLIGTESYHELISAAQHADLPVNTYCLRSIKQSLKVIQEQQAQLVLPGVTPQVQLFDPVTVTFKGGAKEPFVRWYSYLEGYSPQFVKTIFERYAPDATSVLDPFGGTATTAFTASQLGKAAYFCEVNPVLQFISLTKIAVRRLSQMQRSQLANDLMTQRGELLSLESIPPDLVLDRAYQDVFGTSEFFDESTYDQVLRVRTWIDKVVLLKPLLADLLTVAILSALVPASNMKRAGDLRYKTAKELAKPGPSLVEMIRSNISQISHDIQDYDNGLQTQPLLLCENAQSLASIPRLGVDTVITSPPYVNGTNYFRNTKIELWFLRCLLQNRDLTKFRSEAITAGINDVTVDKVPDHSPPAVQEIVNRLAEDAYDSRIPRMIASYFHEMVAAFRSVRTHLQPKAVIAIDIGDSAYAGVHVPVDKLLSTCLGELGFIQEDEVILRHRRSRGGMLLKQSLLVFRYQASEPIFYVNKVIHPWKTQWDDFKETLPHQQQPYAKRNWGHPRHSLCSYPGKLKPAIAYHLVKTFVPPNGKVLDPFAGVGTIPFEAALQGKQAYGFDISPAAFAIANAKVQRPIKDNCFRVIDSLERYLVENEILSEEFAEANEFGFNGKLVEYYETDTLNEILLARRYFQEKQPESAEEWFVLASLLHILHGNRPYALSRRSHPITPYKPTGDFEYRSLVERLTAKVERGFKEPLPEDFCPGKMFFLDATNWWPREIDNLDAIITSPPFFDSTRYYLANWLRLWFAGWSKADFDTRPLGFVDERQKSGFDVYIPLLRQARERLKHDGVVVLHLGKSIKCDMAAELQHLAKRWFRSAEVFDESVAHCESHGVRDKGTVTAHQYLLLS